MAHFLALDDKKKHSLKYLQDLSEELTNYLARSIFSIYDGVTRNIGQNPNLIIKGSSLQKGFLSRFKKLGFKLRGIVGRSIKQKPDAPFIVRGLSLYKKGKPMTTRQWQKFNDQIVSYMRPYIDGLAEEMVVKATLLSMASNEAERQNKKMEEYGNRSYKQVENEYFGGAIPDTIRGAEQRFPLSKNVKQAIGLNYNRVADYITNVQDDLRTSIKQQVLTAHRQKKTAMELASDLYWQKVDVPEMKKYTAEITAKDWRRIAVTELAMVHEDEKLAQYEARAEASMFDSNYAAYFVFTGSGICDFCSKHQGKIVRLVPIDQVKGNSDSLKSMGINDSITDTAIWVSKNNVGRKKANWWLCTPSHPYCADSFVTIDPEKQGWDPKEKRVRYKGGDRFKQYLPEWFTKENDTLQAEIQKQEDLEAKKRVETYYKTQDDIIKEEAEKAKQRVIDQEKARLEYEALPVSGRK